MKPQARSSKYVQLVAGHRFGRPLSCELGRAASLDGAATFYFTFVLPWWFRRMAQNQDSSHGPPQSSPSWSPPTVSMQSLKPEHPPSASASQHEAPPPAADALLIVANEATTDPAVGDSAGEASRSRERALDAPSWPVRILRGLVSAVHWLFGLLSLLVGLAVVAAIPIVQFASLGYFLEASRRVAISGRFADGFPGVRRAATIGGLVLGVWLVQLPLQLVSNMWYSAYLIDSASGVTLGWRRGLLIATALMLGHVFTCCFAGAKLRYFLWPILWPVFALRSWWFGYPLREWFPAAKLWPAIRHGGWYAKARDAVWEFAVALRTPYLFWLGLRGFLGGLAWLSLPVALLIGGASAEPGPAAISGLLGALLLMAVCQHLPMLMTHFAVRQKMSAFLQLGEVRRRFRRTPMTYILTATLVLAFAIPLYLLKVPFIPQQIRWLPSLLFVAFTFPTRILQGFAYARSSKEDRRSWFVVRQFARLAMLPVAAFYVLIVFISQYVAYFGSVSMFGQHAFLLPAPIFGY